MPKRARHYGGGDASLIAVSGRAAARAPGPRHSGARTAADVDPTQYLYECYEGGARRSPLLRAYYGAKPLLPRRMQLALRRAYARRQARRPFPAWPMEPILLQRREARLRADIDARGGQPAPLVGFWPDGHRFAAILTHDVEGPAGIENIPRVLEIEQRHGFVSSWNFVAEWYDIPPGLFDRLRAAGCEIGLHGIKHDGRLFQDRATFDADIPAIRRYLGEWDAAGFRSPATHRNADWMPDLGCLYDTSFPDTDPFEPTAGGCCSILPFMIGGLVELPITLVQDHTLWEILRERSIDRWREKSDWIADNHGLINIIVHPDYVLTRERLDLYEEFLVHLKGMNAGWHALPREVAGWWRARDSMRCAEDGNTARIAGPATAGATLWWARVEDGRIVLDVGEGTTTNRPESVPCNNQRTSVPSAVEAH